MWRAIGNRALTERAVESILAEKFLPGQEVNTEKWRLRCLA